MSQESTRSRPWIALAIFVIGLAVASGTVIAPRLMGMPLSNMSPPDTPAPDGERGHSKALALEMSTAQTALRGAPFLNENGASVTLEAFRGKIVVLNFWATWCPPCVREMPALDRLQAQLGGSDFAVVAVSTDRASMRALRAFYAKTGITHLKLYHDPTGALARAINVTGLPTTVILGQDGQALGRHVGYMEWDHPDFVAWFRRHMN